MLHKVRQFVNENTLMSIYHAVFDSHLNYAYSLGPNKKFNQQVIYYISKRKPQELYILKVNSSLFSESNMIKLPENFFIENCLFVNQSLNNHLPEIFNNWFVLSSDTHRNET